MIGTVGSMGLSTGAASRPFMTGMAKSSTIRSGFDSFAFSIASRPFRASSTFQSRCSNVPLEDSSGDRRRLGHITKQGNSLLRFLLVEAAQVTVRSIPEWRSKYFHLAMRRGRKIAKVAMARRLAIRLYWMWRKGWEYEQVKQFGSNVGQPRNRRGVQQNTE